MELVVHANQNGLRDLFHLQHLGGGGFGNHNINNGLGPAGFANYTFTYDSSGAVAGGDIGYQLQSGQYVIGVEANGMWSDIKGSDATQLANIGFIDADNLRWTGSLVAKGGIAVDRLLLYFTPTPTRATFRRLIVSKFIAAVSLPAAALLMR